MHDDVRPPGCHQEVCGKRGRSSHQEDRSSRDQVFYHRHHYHHNLNHIIMIIIIFINFHCRRDSRMFSNFSNVLISSHMVSFIWICTFSTTPFGCSWSWSSLSSECWRTWSTRTWWTWSRFSDGRGSSTSSSSSVTTLSSMSWRSIQRGWVDVKV